MFFVGREKEIKTVVDALTRGQNVVVTGKFGVGRTALIRHVAQTTPDHWRFIFLDFSRTANQVCQNLLEELLPGYKHEKLGYKVVRFKITHEDPPDRRRTILVLDNLAKLSAGRFDLVRHLAFSKRFGLLPIVEPFVPEADVRRIRAQLWPAAILTLPHLSETESLSFFRGARDHHRLAWEESRIKNLAAATHGYPLLMREAVEREHGKCKDKDGDSH